MISAPSIKGFCNVLITGRFSWELLLVCLTSFAIYYKTMLQTAETKLKKLERILKKMQKILIAFSGGVDSTFLLKVAHSVLGKNVYAVTATSPSFASRELKQAKAFARLLGVNFQIIITDELKTDKYTSNPPDRCYYCKKELFFKLLEIAQFHNIPWVADGSNKDDAHDHRPGMLAIKELGIRQPLFEAGLYKDEIRLLSKKLKLPTWDKPACACLASRLPYGESITVEKLQQIERAENFLKDLGFSQVRVRHCQNTARIEVLPEEMRNFFKQNLHLKVTKKLKKLGYHYVTLDLQGYRSGSMNEVLNKSR